MQLTKQFLEQNNFKVTHNLKLDYPSGASSAEPILRFQPVRKGVSAEPCVYLWAATLPEQGFEVVYVGKAGKGSQRRCRQHEAGFRNSVTGRRNAAALKELLAGGDRELLVFARVSGVQSLFGVPTSLYAAEEDALCRLLGPSLNRAMFPDVSGDVLSETGDTVIVAGNDTGRPGQLARLASLITPRLRGWDEGTIDDLMVQCESCDPQYLQLLIDIVEFLEASVLNADHELKIIGRYSAQTPGCSNVTTLGFGVPANRNFKPDAWVARVYLSDVPRVAFPARLRNPVGAGKADEVKGIFSPQDPRLLLEAPGDFIAPAYLRHPTPEGEREINPEADDQVLS